MTRFIQAGTLPPVTSSHLRYMSAVWHLFLPDHTVLRPARDFVLNCDRPLLAAGNRAHALRLHAARDGIVAQGVPAAPRARMLEPYFLPADVISFELIENFRAYGIQRPS